MEVTKNSLSKAEAFAGVIIAAVASDQELSEDEIKFMQFMFSRMRLFQGWAKEQYNTLFHNLLRVLKQQGLDTFLEMCIRVLPEKLYQTVFAISVDLVLADGSVSREEKDFLYDLQKHLEIDTELASKIIEVIIIKNRG